MDERLKESKADKKQYDNNKPLSLVSRLVSSGFILSRTNCIALCCTHSQMSGMKDNNTIILRGYFLSKIEKFSSLLSNSAGPWSWYYIKRKLPVKLMGLNIPSILTEILFPLEPMLNLVYVSNPAPNTQITIFMWTASHAILQPVIIASEWIGGFLHLHEMRSYYLCSKFKANWADDMYKIRNVQI